jgi:acyl-coenzyme A thioesterase PaaI-like protein
MNLREIVMGVHDKGDYSELVKLIPYAGHIGLRCQRFGNDVVFILPKNESNLGNPILPAIHGGVIGGFMELAASLHLIMFNEAPKLPKIVDFSIDYLRAGLHRETYAECRVSRQGNRVANVIVTAWQKSRDEPIALARAHFILE